MMTGGGNPANLPEKGTFRLRLTIVYCRSCQINLRRKITAFTKGLSPRANVIDHFQKRREIVSDVGEQTTEIEGDATCQSSFQRYLQPTSLKSLLPIIPGIHSLGLANSRIKPVVPPPGNYSSNLPSFPRALAPLSIWIDVPNLFSP